MTPTHDTISTIAVLEALADPKCRRIIDELETALTAKDIAERCDFSKTSTYRKLDQLTEAGLIEERQDVRSDGNPTTYGRDFSTVIVTYEDEYSFDVTVSTDTGVADDSTPDFSIRCRPERK